MANDVAKATRLTYAMQTQLLGAWLQEIGLEHMQYFSARDFDNEELFKALKSGKKAIDIPSMNIGYTMADIAKLIGDYVPTFYRQALQRAEEIRVSAMASRIIAGEFMADKDLRKLQERLESINRFGRVPEAEKDLFARMKADMEYRKNENAVKYGMPYLDKLTKGIHRKELTTLAARPGVGKSSFALQIAAHAVKCGEKVLYFTLEMPVEQQMYRLLLQTHKSTKEDLDEYFLNGDAEMFVNKVEKSQLLKFYEGVNQLPEICAAIRSQKPYLVVLDQLTQIKISGRSWKSRLEELQEITATLKKVSMEENVAIMLLCQINRDAANSEPSLANLKGSGQIEEDSDNVILLHNLEKNDELEPKPTKRTQIKLEKQRSGGTANYTIVFNPKQYRFFEMERE